MNVTGTVSATSYAASATGIAILGGGSVPVLLNSGTISATVNFGADSQIAVGGNATAIVVQDGAVSSIINSGVISAEDRPREGIRAQLGGRYGLRDRRPKCGCERRCRFVDHWRRGVRQQGRGVEYGER